MWGCRPRPQIPLALQLVLIEDGASQYRNTFAQFMTMREKQILARAIAWMPTKKIAGNHAFFRDNQTKQI